MAIIEPFEFTSSKELVEAKQAQVNEMLQSNDLNQQRLGSSQAFINALFGDPSVKKAKATEDAIKESMSLEKEEEEDELDYQTKVLENIRANTSSVDPNVALQANQRILGLKKEQEARELLESEESRSKNEELRKQQESFRKQKEYEDKNTWIIASTLPDGDFSPSKTYAYGTDINDVMTDLQIMQQENPKETFRLTNLFDATEDERVPTNTIGNDTPYTRKTVSKDMGTIETAVSTLNSFMPIMEQLSIAENSLLNVKINSKGEVESGAVNNFFDGLTRFSNEVKNAWDTLGNGGVETADGTIAKDVGRYIKAKFEESLEENNIPQQGINIAVAEARVKALAYAIAASRDPNGRLSDQDVNMALGSIVGNGSLMSVTTLIIDNLRQLNENVQFISEKYKNYTSILTPGMKNRYNNALNKVAGYSTEMIQTALDSGAVTASGATDIFGNKLEIDDTTNVLVENKPLIAKNLFEKDPEFKGLVFDEIYKEFYTKLQANRQSRNEEAATDDEAQTLFIEVLKAKRGNK